MTPRRALVTGASSGIGAAVVTELVARGWHVTGLARRPLDDAVTGSGAVTGIRCDLGDPDDLDRALTEAGPADAVVHAAGHQVSAPLGELDLAAGEGMWRVHVGAAEQILDSVARTMPDGGRVVLIGSRTMTGAAGKAQYAATKAALTGLARSAAIELMGRGITVNVVAPGPTATPMLDDPARSATPVRVPPMGRLIEPSEIAATVEFLLGENAGSITGQTLVQCAGASLT